MLPPYVLESKTEGASGQTGGCPIAEMKRLGRGAAELLAVPENPRHHDIQLELLRVHSAGSMNQR